MAARRQLATLRRKAKDSGDQADYVKLLEEEVSELEGEVGGVHDRISELMEKLEDRKEETRQLMFENFALKAQLSKAGRGQVDLASSSEVQEVFSSLLDNRINIAQCLLLAAALLPDRFVILDSAWSSTESSKFKDGMRVLRLLWLLGTDYWTALVDGKGDGEAGKVFGKSYAARESESVENNKRAKDLRTFEYGGEFITMWRHLKIGIKPSKTATFRAHFHWDPVEKRIVVGHCGEHLDHR